MELIAAVTENWGIGASGRLLLSIPEDMKFFRETTRGSAVIMGRKTLLSFPGENPLKGRENIVLTTDEKFEKVGVTIVHSISDAILEAKRSGREKIFVIGGESVYRQMLPYCHRAFITKMEITLPADSFFPNLDSAPNWVVTENSPKKEYEGVKYSFITYENTNVRV